MFIHLLLVSKVNIFTLSEVAFVILLLKIFVMNYLDQSYCPPRINYSLEWDSFDWLANSQGQLDLDFIGRFSNLEFDFKRLCDKLGIDYIPLTLTNESTHSKYTDYYDSELCSYVAEKYSKEIDFLTLNLETNSHSKEINACFATI